MGTLKKKEKCIESPQQKNIKNISGRGVFLIPAETPYHVDCIVRIPENLSHNSRIIVAVHGISRSPLQQISAFAESAEDNNAVIIAPYFNKKTWRGYQKLFCPRKGRRADKALINSLEHIRSLLELDQNKIFLHGYSGGGQFVHRFAILHPEKVEAVALGAAGWYTMPDISAPFPLGLGNAQDEGFNPAIDPLAFMDLRFFVAVGDDDTRQDKSLNQTPEIAQIQGVNRLKRAKNWVEILTSYMLENSARGHVELYILQGIGHSFIQFMSNKEYSNNIEQFFFGQG